MALRNSLGSWGASLGRYRLWASTILRLGPANAATVAAYRALLRVGGYRRRLPVLHQQPGILFREQDAPPPPSGIDPGPTIVAADDLLAGHMDWFGRHRIAITTPPDWFLDPFNGNRVDAAAHWSQIPDFDAARADIKCIWEPSRFGWALVLARAYRLTGESRYLQALNDWCYDWQENNPPNRGPNWKCGQETAIRVLSVLLSAYVLNQHRLPTQALIGFMAQHCRRIAPTIRYALAQDNNHGTSEAAALFVAGAWLASVGAHDQGEATRWARMGRRWLEERVGRLVATDGSFSQYSVNYHRLLLDTLSMAELWRRTLDLPGFSTRFVERARMATNWHYQLTDPITGDAPNIGANDGANLYTLHTLSYRDFRPSVQLAYALFHGARPYEPGPWDEPLHWLGIQVPHKPVDHVSIVFRQGGYVKLHSFMTDMPSWGLIRFPRYRTRPAHADGLHFDLWVDGQNLLRDGGSYSYANGAGLQLRGCQAHNTIQFDDRDQMPSLGRFMYGDWLEADGVGVIESLPDGCSWTGAYTDGLGCQHRRTVSVHGNTWRVLDRIQGGEQGTLRWRLAPDSWSLDRQTSTLTGKAASITVSTDAKIVCNELVQGWESRHYMEKTPIPVWEVSIAQNGAEAVLETRITLGGC